MALVGAGLIVATFAYFLPTIANYGDVWRVVQQISWQWLVALAAVTVLNVLTFAPPWMVALPGLSFTRALEVTQASTAISIVIPAGVAAGAAAAYGMLRRWGFSAREVARAVTLTSLWNQLLNLSYPIVAVFLLTLAGDETALLATVAFVGVAVLGVVVAGLVLVLMSKSLAGDLGDVAARFANWALGKVRKGPVGWGGASFERFRADAGDLLARRWHALTLASLAGSLSVFLVLLVALRALDVTASEVSTVEAFAAWALVRMLATIPITPGGVGRGRARAHRRARRVRRRQRRRRRGRARLPLPHHRPRARAGPGRRGHVEAPPPGRGPGPRRGRRRDAKIGDVSVAPSTDLDRIRSADRFLIQQIFKPIANEYRISIPAEGSTEEGEPILFVKQKKMKIKEDIRFRTSPDAEEHVFMIKSKSVFEFRGRHEVLDDAGRPIGVLEKVFGKSLLRSHWYVRDASGEVLLESHEASWIIALVRRFAELGPDIFSLLSWLPFNFVLKRDGEEVGRYKRVLGTFRDRYVLELDEGLKEVDHRLVLAFAIGLDALQDR